MLLTFPEMQGRGFVDLAIGAHDNTVMFSCRVHGYQASLYICANIPGLPSVWCAKAATPWH